jgi:two-component system sensor kinase
MSKPNGSHTGKLSAAAMAAARGKLTSVVGKFQIERRLKGSEDVACYVARDPDSGQMLVIKTLPAERFSAAGQMRLEHAIDAQKQLDQPWLAPLIEHGSEEKQVYVVAPYVSGIPLAARLRRGPLLLGEALTVGRCVLAALRDAHHLGLLHGDVSPKNVIVDEGVPLQGATLIDLGLSASLRLDTSSRDWSVSIAHYMSPERAGMLDVDAGWPSDLYSLGVVLFECLTGEPPFRGDSVGEVLRRHMTAPLPPLRQAGQRFSRALDEVLKRLLCKDPRDRYQSAEAVLADLDAITEAHQRGVREPAIVVGLHDRRRTLTEPAFVGRNHELQELEHHLDEACRGDGGLVVLEAKSGDGKTRLLNEFAQRCAGKDVWVLRGQGLDRVGRQPFQVLERVVGELISNGKGRRAHTDAVVRRLHDHRHAIGDALPALALALGWKTRAKLGPEAFGAARSLEALTHFLEALGDIDCPAVVLLDDCQWADELTLRLLARWHSNAAPRARRRFVMLVAAYRSDDLPPGHRLKAMNTRRRLHLAPFRPEDVHTLTESMAGPLPPEALSLVERFSDGSPFMASAILRGLVESRAMVPDKVGWRMDPLAIEDLQSSQHAGVVLARRLDLLPEDALALLSAAAVLGKEFELDSAVKLTGQSGAQAISALDEARDRHLLWAGADGAKCTFVHDRIRTALLDRLPHERRRELHKQAAVLFQKGDSERVFDIAYHFDQAGESQRALPYALTAAEQARFRHGAEIAEQQYRIAQRGASQAEDTVRYRISEGLGDVLMLRGKYELAANELQEALRLARDDTARARLEGKLGELAFKQGDLKTATDAYEQALLLLGCKVPKRTLPLLLLTLREALVQVAHSLFPTILVGRREATGAELEFLSIRLYSRLAYAYWFARGPVPTLWAHLRETNLAERYEPTLELAQAYSEHAPVMTLIPYIRRGIAYAERSLVIRKQHEDLWGQGQSLHFYGLVLYAASRFEECIERCREAVRLLERTGDLWEVNIARHQIAASLYRLGDLQGAIEEAKRIRRSAKELNDKQAAGFSLDVWSRASDGRVPAEMIQAELERSQDGDDVQVDAQICLAEGIRLIREGEPSAAAHLLEVALKRVRHAGMWNVFVVSLVPWLATALREQAESTPPFAVRLRRTRVRWAARHARQACRVARRFPNDLSHALRESALVAALAGRESRARKLLSRSLKVAEQHQALYEQAKTLLARGRLGDQLGWDGADRDLSQGRELLSKLTRPSEAGLTATNQVETRLATLSLVDRFDNILDAGRRIAGALSPKEVYSEALEAVRKLLRAETCLVLEVNDDEQVAQLQNAEIAARVSRHLVEAAVRRGALITLNDESPDDIRESVLMTGARSAICIPIDFHDRITACVYATHRQVADLFSEDDVRLAGFVSAIASAALENAEGFAELQRLNATLEQRVAERTASIEAQKQELARSNAELEQFAYVASHDLQEPLRTVASYCELLKRRYAGSLDEDADKFIQSAIAGATRMRNLINDLLTYSRVGTRGRAFEPTDMAEVLNEAIANLTRTIEEHQAIISHDELPVIHADATQMTQLLQNLIGNGIKFRSEKTPHVHIGAQHRSDAWVFSIRDNGTGIEDKHFERIFKIFQRLHRREEYAGTGIGLAVCRKTVERHGGRIWVESTPGEGATFYFSVPHCSETPEEISR